MVEGKKVVLSFKTNHEGGDVVVAALISWVKLSWRRWSTGSRASPQKAEERGTSLYSCRSRSSIFVKESVRKQEGLGKGA